MSWYKNREVQETMGRKAAKGKVNMAKTIFEAKTRSTKAEKAAAAVKKPVPSANSNKHAFKGLAPGAWGKSGNHWTIARKPASGNVVTGTPANRFAEQSAPEPVSPRKSITNTLRTSFRKSVRSVKSLVSDKSDKSDTLEQKRTYSDSTDEDDRSSHPGVEETHEEEEQSMYSDSDGEGAALENNVDPTSAPPAE
eukprot:CAMPEP_0171464240 /NCGR_PEP_ID=MMETSP0945-20130129/7620_1 /TAXON_ID=109269 /ORGANISM="Vaucheria litorea, Strain CCMP2940" /LENGTH=194 /DNA_ID=CAMNT_0011991253 /DNA_START=116 /DNA_END=697 /DNA_ORIENTATION=+